MPDTDTDRIIRAQDIQVDIQPDETGRFNINDASRASGLSPSVLRIWEARYGWPKPERKPNGYRVYTKEHVEALKRVADLVRCGMPISTILIDGEPRWPAELVQAPKPRSCPRARMLPEPKDHAASRLQREALDAIETGRGHQAIGVIQRATMMIRPASEPLALLAPLIVGLAELRQNDRAPSEDAQLDAAIATRAQQLLRMRRLTSTVVHVIPGSLADHALASVGALFLCLHGINAQPWLNAARPTRDQIPGAWIRAGAPFQPPGMPQPKAVLSVLGDGDEDAIGLAELLDGALPSALNKLK